MTDGLPWLSIVTVVKDDLVGLRRTRASLETQDHQGTQWVVVDSSRDGGAVHAEVARTDILCTYQWVEPAGVYDAMNRALNLCRGEYVWFVNAGDEIEAGATLLMLRSALAEHPLWLVGQVAFVTPGGERTVPRPFDYARERDSMFARGRFAPHQGTVVQTEWLREHGGFAHGYTVAADYEASLRLSRVEDPAVIDAVLAVFRTGGLSATRWRTSVAEFHRARREVLRPSGGAAMREWGLTGVSLARESAGAALRRLRRGD